MKTPQASQHDQLGIVSSDFQTKSTNRFVLILFLKKSQFSANQMDLENHFYLENRIALQQDWIHFDKEVHLSPNVKSNPEEDLMFFCCIFSSKSQYCDILTVTHTCFHAVHVYVLWEFPLSFRELNFSSLAAQQQKARKPFFTLPWSICSISDCVQTM